MTCFRVPSTFCLGGISLFLLMAPVENCALAQGAVEKPAVSESIVRPCSEVRTDPKPRHKDKRKGSGTGQVAMGCLEAKGAPLEIQEFFQSYIRAQSWRFSDEKIVADGWMFVRHLDKDELLQFAKEGRFAGRVSWTEGKALVLVTTSELDDGFTRTEVKARLQGFGQRVDQFAPPKDTWDLDSSGVLEKTLISALEDHIKSSHSAP